MKVTRFVELRILLHSDLVERIEEIAQQRHESLESCIESLLRERTGFAGPKAPAYLKEPK